MEPAWGPEPFVFFAQTVHWLSGAGMKVSVALSLLLLWVWTGPVRAQTKPAAATESATTQAGALPSDGSGQQENPVFRTGTTLVLVPALVRTEKGELVFTLTANDFSLTDNGVPQKLALEEDSGSQPLALAIVVETGGAGAQHFASYSKLGGMLESVVGAVPEQVAVIGFDSEPLLVQDFTSNLDEANAALNHLQPGDDGDAILDSLRAAVDLLRKQPPTYRRAILLVSETLDRGSQLDLAGTLRAISDTNTAIYSMGFSSSRAQMKHEAGQFDDREDPGPAGGCMSRGPRTDPDADSDADIGTSQDGDAKPAKKQGRAAQAYDCASLLVPPLRAAKMLAMLAMNGLRKNVPETVARLTGGEYYKFENEKNFERSLVTISNHIPNRYVLSFRPLDPQAGLHEIKLQLNGHPKLKVTARNSYWVDGPDSPARSK